MTEAKADTAKTLRERLVLAMKDIGYLQKDGRNTSQSYSYLSERKVKEECQKAFVKYGLVPEWEMRIEHAGQREHNGKGGFDAIVRADLLFEPTSGGGDSVRASGLGQGRDPGDKAVMKAQTAAVRECLKNLFLIASGDDPEAMDPEGNTRVADKPRKVTKKEVLDKIKRVSTKKEMESLKMDMPALVDGMPDSTVKEIRKVFQTKATAIAEATEKAA